MSKENYEAIIKKINAIPDDKTLMPVIPVAVYIQEAEDQYEWAKDDIDDLVRAGMDNTLFEDIPVRAGALRYAQSIWQKEYKIFEEAQKIWNREAPEAFDLHDIIIHDFFHAYCNDQDIYAKVQNIASGGGNADMLQDMSDLAVLGKSNPEQLKKINFDLSLLDKAAGISSDLSEILAKANGLRMSDNASKITRDKAYTYLKKAIDEIRHHGQYLFWRNEERRKGYISLYLKNYKRRHTGKDVNVMG